VESQTKQSFSFTVIDRWQQARRRWKRRTYVWRENEMKDEWDRIVRKEERLIGLNSWTRSSYLKNLNRNSYSLYSKTVNKDSSKRRWMRLNRYDLTFTYLFKDSKERLNSRCIPPLQSSSYLLLFIHRFLLNSSRTYLFFFFFFCVRFKEVKTQEVNSITFRTVTKDSRLMRENYFNHLLSLLRLPFAIEPEPTSLLRNSKQGPKDEWDLTTAPELNHLSLQTKTIKFATSLSQSLLPLNLQTQ